MKKLLGGVVLAFVFLTSAARADVSAAVYTGLVGAPHQPVATRMGLDLMYGMRPYFRWGGDFFVQGGEPSLRWDFGPKVQVFLDPFESPFRLAFEASYGPMFLQHASGYEVGSVLGYGGGMGAEFGETRKFSVLAGLHGVTRVDKDQDKPEFFGFVRFGFTFASEENSFSAGGEQEE